MKALVYDTSGVRAGELRVAQLPDPEPGHGEVRVRVAWSGINPTDVKARAGYARAGFPWVVPNQDGAGVIDQLGDGVSRERLGQRVWVYHAAYERQMGTAAEYTCVPEHLAVPLPDGIASEHGATLGIPAITAHRCLSLGRGPSGQTVLVTGGAGAVGNAAIQLARWMEAARVVATTSDASKAQLADDAGADVSLDYRHDDFSSRLSDATPDGIDLVVDVAIASNLGSYLAAMNLHGEISSYASVGSPLRVNVSPLMRRNLALRFCHVYSTPLPDVARATEDINAALEAGALNHLPLHRFALGDADRAYTSCADGVVGRALLQLSHDP